jgi:hypothetical protein
MRKYGKGKVRQTTGRGPADADRSQQETAETTPGAAYAQEFSGGEMLGVELGPILFEDAMVGFDVTPHFNLQMGVTMVICVTSTFREARAFRSAATDCGVSEGRPMM